MSAVIRNFEAKGRGLISGGSKRTFARFGAKLRGKRVQNAMRYLRDRKPGGKVASRFRGWYEARQSGAYH